MLIAFIPSLLKSIFERKSAMIGVTFKGRLGNQIFQYVFLQYLRQQAKGTIVFSPNPHHAYLGKYFNLEPFDNITLNSKLYSIFSRFIPLTIRFRNIDIHNFVSPKVVRPRNFSIYNGYYQTDWYYNQMIVKPRISLKKKYVERFNQRYGQIFQNEKTVVVHIRRTDYLRYGKRDISLPIEHFKYQLSLIEDLESYKVFFVSDDVEFVKQAFTEKSNYFFSTNDEITDFQLIQNADIAIISNSSFAWWAAFLSLKEIKVIAPKNWMGFRLGAEHPKGVMTLRFCWVDVLAYQHRSL